MDTINISIHAPPRGATQYQAPRGNLVAFQFTPLREGRRGLWLPCHIGYSFQFTPLREGRPYSNYYLYYPPFISIHAPPRGATHNGCWLIKNIVFQFTPLREGRRGLNSPLLSTVSISIHAPPRGATAPAATRPSSHKFQFTPLREGRQTTRKYSRCARANFNSRPSARGDNR